ncbi:MAG: VCBS repeat-containing protein, partial [Candidatus Aureabacteria bacterium]|nr:VCBS repeat-containing protein [Candidatus Auribacterota bacterium]
MVGSDWDSAVSILLGNGDGTFRPNVDYPSGPRLSAVMDVNYDGRLDVVTAGDGGIWVLLGNGNGTFQARRGYAAGWATSVLPADVNGDNKKDLVVVVEDDFGAGVAVLLNKSTGGGGGGDGLVRTLDARGMCRFTDASGDSVLVQLIGGGTGTLYFPAEGNSDLSRIVLAGT